MALFGKRQMTVDDILKAIGTLSEEEKAKVKDVLVEKEETVETPENGGESVESETVETETSETEPEQSEETTEETEQVEETPETDETETEETAEEVTVEENGNKDEVIEALTMRLDELDEKYAKVMEILNTLYTGTDDNVGARATDEPVDTDDYASEDDKIMRKFYGDTYRK